jgi:hypothetical protein
MCDNEYVAHRMVRERIREAEARGVLNAMLEAASPAPRPSGRDGAAGPGRLETWRHAASAWVAHLTLPKTWNRL